MVDFQSRYRLYSLGYTGINKKEGTPSYHELYKSTAPYLFKSGANATHDCRLDILKEHEDRKDWETQLLCHGLRQTCADVNKLHEPQITRDDGNKTKLLFHLGVRGSEEGDFYYPRALSISKDGDLLIADTMNNRIQVLNQCGVFKFTIGKKGESEGEFNNPTGITVLPNEEIVVADSKNRRIQIFHPDRSFKSTFRTKELPFSVTGDSHHNIIVGTSSRSIEIYNKNGKPIRSFRLRSTESQRVPVYLHVCCNAHDQLVILDPENQKVLTVTQTGKIIQEFNLDTPREGLSISASCICLAPNGHIIIGDSLNHTVFRYSDKGELHDQFLGPTDNVGPLQSCAVWPEGHLVVSEFSVTGDHCVKIFRFSDCRCHMCRPGSSKRRALTKSPEKEIPIRPQSVSASNNENPV